MTNSKKPLRKAGRQNKREVLLNAAIEVFAKKGSNVATIADIAKKARVALGTVYVYFTSKDDLLQHCMKEIIDVEIAHMIKETSHIADPMDRLNEFFQQHIALVRGKPFIARFITVETRQSESFLLRNPGYNPLHSYLEYVREVAVGAIKDGKIKAVDPDAFAMILVGSMDIVLWQWLSSEHSMDITTMSQQIRQIIHAGVALNP